MPRGGDGKRPEAYRSAVGLFRRFRAWRAARREERAAIARARQELMRAGDEHGRTQTDAFESAAGEFPPPS